MPKHKRIRIIGKQRKVIDVDRLVQAVVLLGRELWQQRQAKESKEKDDSETGEAPEDRS